jgi:hypothetical protein
MEDEGWGELRESDRDKLREDLIRIYSEYAKDPTDAHMKRRARSLHTECGNAGTQVDKVMRLAVSMLVNIGWDMPEPPKPSREDAEKLVFALATRKS